jgi:hypothetical protein
MMDSVVFVALPSTNPSYARQPSVKIVLSEAGLTCPLIIWRSSLFEQFGIGEQMTLSPLLRTPTTGIFYAAPRPGMPRTLRGPK